jgi:hypothetical protein
MLSYSINNFIFNFYDVNTEKDIIEQNGIDVSGLPIDSLAPGMCAMPIRTMSVSSGTFTIPCFYTLKQKSTHITIASNFKESNTQTVLAHVVDHYTKVFLNGQVNWQNDSTQLSVLKYTGIDNGIMYYIDSSTMFESIKKPIPHAVCSHYSDPSIKLYSSGYPYANDTRMPNCSNPTMIKNSHGSAVPCMYSAQDTCPLYQKNETQIKLDYFYNNLIDIKENKYELVKTYFSDSTIHYAIKVDDVLFSSFSNTYSDQSSVELSDLSAINVYEEVIKTTSNLHQIEHLEEQTQTQNQSYILGFVSQGVA